MIVLDTNVISALMQETPDEQIVRWLDCQSRPSVWTTAVNIYEIRFGLLRIAPGKRCNLLTSLFEQVLTGTIEGRIANFDRISAERAAELQAEREKKGRPGEARDTMIAGIVLASHATLATRNVRHFEDIAKYVVNPWE